MTNNTGWLYEAHLGQCEAMIYSTGISNARCQSMAMVQIYKRGQHLKGHIHFRAAVCIAHFLDHSPTLNIKAYGKGIAKACDLGCDARDGEWVIICPDHGKIFSCDTLESAKLWAKTICEDICSVEGEKNA
jgi:predicted cupin superfamily sugar epimerase